MIRGLRFDSKYYDSFEEANRIANNLTRCFREYNTAVRNSTGWYITNRFDPSCGDKSKGKSSNIIKPNRKHKEQNDG